MDQHVAEQTSECAITAREQCHAKAFLPMESDLTDALCLSRITAKLLEDVEGDGFGQLVGHSDTTRGCS